MPRLEEGRVRERGETCTWVEVRRCQARGKCEEEGEGTWVGGRKDEEEEEGAWEEGRRVRLRRCTGSVC